LVRFRAILTCFCSIYNTAFAGILSRLLVKDAVLAGAVYISSRRYIKNPIFLISECQKASIM